MTDATTLWVPATRLPRPRAQLVDAEATAVIGAERYERSGTRTTQRNGSRVKTVATTSGDVEVTIPKLRAGSFFPSLLQPRRRIDAALHAVVMEAFVNGVSTRKVDNLVQALGADSGISKSEVSRICAGLDEEIGAWLARPLDHIAFRYVFLDATYVKARVGGTGPTRKGARVASQAVVVAVGVSTDGRREITVLVCAAWQRCRVHFIRNALARVPKASAEMVAATIRTIFAQPTAKLVREQVDTVADILAPKFPAVAELLHDAKADLTAFADFPTSHCARSGRTTRSLPQASTGKSSAAPTS